MVATTTLTAFRTAMITQIEAVTPTNHTAETWALARGPLVGGPKRRSFRLTFSPSELQDGEGLGLWGGGNSYDTEMRIVCSYGRMQDEDDETLIDQDGEDLYHALIDSGVAGLIYISPPSWEPEEDDDGWVWGAHVFECRIFKSDGV